jgi:hypothetical protein
MKRHKYSMEKMGLILGRASLNKVGSGGRGESALLPDS